MERCVDTNCSPREFIQFFFSDPIIFVACRIYVVGDVAVVVGGKYHIEAFGEEVVFVVFERGHQRVSFAVFLPEYGFLSHTRLYLLVHVGVGESEHQTVGPVFIFYSDFGYDGFVVIGVVKPFYPFRLFGIEIGRPVFFVTFLSGHRRDSRCPSSFGMRLFHT